MKTYLTRFPLLLQPSFLYLGSRKLNYWSVSESLLEVFIREGRLFHGSSKTNIKKSSVERLIPTVQRSGRFTGLSRRDVSSKRSSVNVDITYFQ